MSSSRVVTFTPNPALDMTWRAASTSLGESHRVEAGEARGGGKGINVARVVASQGGAAKAVAALGGTVGAEFLAEMTASGLPFTAVPVAMQTRRSVAIYNETAGDTAIFNEHGTAPTAAEWRAIVAAIAAELDAGAGVLVISGSWPPGMGAAELDEVMELARSRGIPAIVDTSGPLLLEAARRGAALVKPNREELLAATGEASALEGIAALLRLGAGAVMCSLGEHGLLLTSGPDLASGVPRARLAAPLVGNPTGAGDAAVAAAATLIAAGVAADDGAVLSRAAAWSAAAVLAPHAGEISPRATELEAALIFDSAMAESPSGAGTESEGARR